MEREKKEKEQLEQAKLPFNQRELAFTI